LALKVKIARTRTEARAWRKAHPETALVPTMGSLHEGHLSLVAIARREAPAVAMSIFVNPLQFGTGEDFETYPRDMERDLELAERAGVDLVFAPPVEEMYPDGEPWVEVVPRRGADRLCGAGRPGHFTGVLTVVARLFGIFAPEAAVFGEKDFQQLALIRRMVRDLEMEVRVIGAPTVREPDGLAMSSRNRYLSPGDRERALGLSAALRECAALFGRGARDADAFRHALQLARDYGVSVEYADVVDPETLEPAERVRAGHVCAIAGRVGETRLIDNLILGS
jgi:pantoate--beta-alanine ligase